VQVVLPLAIYAAVQVVHLILAMPHVFLFAHHATVVAQDADPGMIFKV
jgi:hypothetical protein